MLAFLSFTVGEMHLILSGVAVRVAFWQLFLGRGAFQNMAAYDSVEQLSRFLSGSPGALKHTLSRVGRRHRSPVSSQQRAASSLDLVNAGTWTTPSDRPSDSRLQVLACHDVRSCGVVGGKKAVRRRYGWSTWTTPSDRASDSRFQVLACHDVQSCGVVGGKKAVRRRYWRVHMDNSIVGTWSGRPTSPLC